MPSSNLILSHPVLLLSPIPPSIRVFSNESTLPMRWPKYWSFSFSIIPSKEIPGLISIRMDWLDLLAVQGTLKSLLQHHSSKASILQCSALIFFRSLHIKWLYLSFPPLPLACLLFTATCKASLDNYFAFLHFFFLGMVLITASCVMSWTSIHSSSYTLSIRSSPLHLFLTSTV